MEPASYRLQSRKQSTKANSTRANSTRANFTKANSTKAHSTKANCQFCNRELATRSSLKRHIIATHPDVAARKGYTKGDHPCQQCDEHFSRKESLSRHVDSIHLRALQSCPTCFKPFRDDYLKPHKAACAQRFLEKACTLVEDPGLATDGAAYRPLYQRIDTSLSSLSRSQPDVEPLSRANQKKGINLQIRHELALDLTNSAKALQYLLDVSLAKKDPVRREQVLELAFRLGIRIVSPEPPRRPESAFGATTRRCVEVVNRAITVARASTNEADVNMVDDQGRTLLHHVCHLGLTGLLEPLFWRGADVDRADHDHQTPLCLAAAGGHLDVVRFALALGADPDLGTPWVSAIDGDHRNIALLLQQYHALPSWWANRRTGSLLKVATLEGDVDRMRFLLSIKKAETHSIKDCLRHAICSGSAELATLLLEHGADINAKTYKFRTPLDNAARDAGIESVCLALELGADVKIGAPLHYAIVAENSESAKVLMQHGADIDRPCGYRDFEKVTGGTHYDWANDHTPLTAAVWDGTIETVRLALSLGADPNIRAPYVTAIQMEKPEIAALLLEHGADAFGRDQGGNTSLHAALHVCRTDPSALRSILDGRVPTEFFNTCNNQGWTPLHVAANLDLVDGARMLLDAGASIKTLGRSGHTALWLASYGSRDEMVRLLLDKTPRNVLHLVQVQSSMEIAAERRYYSTVEVLLKGGIDAIDLTEPGLRQMAPLESAIHHCSTESVQLLLEKGAPMDDTFRFSDTIPRLHERLSLTSDT